MKSICLIGQFPEPVHGLSKALESIRTSRYLNDKFTLTHINITDNKKFLSHIKSIRKNKSDIYYFTISHSKFGNIRDLIILNELVKKKKRIIIHYHGGYFKELYNNMTFIQKYANRRLLSKVDIVIVLSSSLRPLFEGIIEDSKIKICENFVEDSSLLSEEKFQLKMDNLKKKNEIRILYLSNFIKSKGYFDVLKAAKTFKHDPIKFSFAGKFFSEKEKNEFMQYIAVNKLKNVKYHGIVDGKEKKDLIENSDVFILPTYYHIEGQPISLIEAMANGLTVITTNHAGIPDIVTAENGYLVEPNHVYEIEKSIRDINRNRNKLVEFGYYNRKYALKSFKEDDYIKRLEKIFNEV